MSDSLPGLLGPIILDGVLLRKATLSEEDVVATKVKELVELADGGCREAFAFQGDGYPIIGVKHRVTLKWRNIRGEIDRLEELLGLPGPHALVTWKRTNCTYISDGASDTFLLPWQLAEHFYDYPDSFDANMETASGAEVRVGISETADVRTVLHKTQIDYDAGTPAANEAWFLEGGQEFKLASAPTIGAFVFLRMVPILRVFEDGPMHKNHQSQSGRMESRDLVLRER